MGLFQSCVLWGGRENGNITCFAGVVHISKEKTVTAPKSTALAAYPVQVIRSNVKLRKMQSLIDNRHVLVGFVHICGSVHEVVEGEGSECDDTLVYRFASSTPVLLGRHARVTGNWERISNKLKALHNVAKVVKRPLKYYELRGFVVKAG